MNQSADSITGRLKRRAVEVGFSLVGVTTAATPARLKSLHEWLDNGYSGQMHYIQDRRDAYSHPGSVLDGCRSLLMLGVPYLAAQSQRPSNDGAIGKVARYAQCGHDYHDVIRGWLKELKRWLVHQVPGARVRGVVDTAPLLEREFAQVAGLGWIGKNTLLLNKTWGSYFFLAALLTDLQLEPDEPHATSHCGTCTACLDHCPTDAFREPYVLDASRCISYMTIEHPGEIADPMQNAFNGWIFGCDICQEVCPWNRKSELTSDSTWEAQAEFGSLNVIDVLNLTPVEFATRYRKTPLWRSKYRGLVRNAILLAGTQQMADAVKSLRKLQSSDDELLSQSATWALEQIVG